MEWRYPTAFSAWRPCDDSEEWAAYERVLRSGRLTMGPETEAFEAEIASYHGRMHAIAVNSGSSANEIAMAAIMLTHHPKWTQGPSDAIRSASVPSIAWATTYGPCHRNGYGSFELRDADDTWNSPLPPLRDMKFPRWSWGDMLVACPILGNPLDDRDYERVIALKAERPDQYHVLEDNCESLGACTADGWRTGTFGDVSTGSGFYSHQLSAVELGWILTDDGELARLCRLLRNHGNAGWGAQELEDRYDFVTFGYNMRPVEAHCAVARVQLARLDKMAEVRRWNLSYFKDQTYRLPVMHQRTIGRPNPFGLAFEVEDRDTRHRLAAALREAGIDSRLPTGGSFLRHAYGAPWRDDQSTPRADLIHDRGMFLGNAPYEIPGLIEAAVNVMREVI